MSDDVDRQNEADVAALLAAAGARAEPADSQRERWQRHFAAELRNARRRRYQRRLTLAAGACAAALVLAVVWRWTPPAEPPVQVAEVVTVIGGSTAAGALDGRRVLSAGAGVFAGDRVETGLNSTLGLRYLGADLRLDAGTEVAFAVDALELREGQVYVDTGPAGPSAGLLRVVTPAGEFRHLGTQFVVAVEDGTVRGAVREGSIELRGSRGHLELEATASTARMVTVDANGEVHRSDVARRGPLWAWALRSAPGLVLAGRSADEVLRWAARELGLELVYADAAARSAAQEPLAGSLAAADPAGAVAVIRMASGLSVAESADGRLEVRARSASEADQHTQ